jgi:hypothetical protein
MALVMMTGVHLVLGRKLFGDCFEGIIRKMKCSLFFGSSGLFRRERWGGPWEGGAHIKGP